MGKRSSISLGNFFFVVVKIKKRWVADIKIDSVEENLNISTEVEIGPPAFLI